MDKSSTYSFAATTIVATLAESVGAYPANTPINLTSQGFFDKTDNVVIEPQTEYIVDDVGPGGELYPSVTEDKSGMVTFNVADKTPAHQFFVAVIAGHRNEKNIKGVSITVRERSVGGTGELIYSAVGGYCQPAAARKSFGARQTGNSYPFRFEKVLHDIEG